MIPPLGGQGGARSLAAGRLDITSVQLRPHVVLTTCRQVVG